MNEYTRCKRCGAFWETGTSCPWCGCTVPELTVRPGLRESWKETLALVVLVIIAGGGLYAIGASFWVLFKLAAYG
jgi:hypothetical protein